MKKSRRYWHPRRYWLYINFFLTPTDIATMYGTGVVGGLAYKAGLKTTVGNIIKAGVRDKVGKSAIKINRTGSRQK